MEKTPTREEIITRINADLELQRLSTELQELRTRHLLASIQELQLMQKFEDLTKSSQPTQEDITEMLKEANANQPKVTE
jgi:hypothetical protein